MNTTQVVWLRNDLRIKDNPALFYASQNGPVEIIISVTPEQWRAHAESPAKFGLRADLITLVTHQCAELGIKVSLIEADYFSDLPDKIVAFCQSIHAHDLWFNQETPLDERRRDTQVGNLSEQHGITVHPQATDLIVARPVFSQQGTPFKVFTPFYKRWLQILSLQDRTPLPSPAPQGKPLDISHIDLPWHETYRNDLWPTDAESIKQRLWLFCHHKESHYNDQRDIPSLAGTSTLSPYLSLGAIGPRELLFAIEYNCDQAGRDWMSSIWLKELAWRDFYRQLLLHFEALNMSKPFKLETDQIVWNSPETTFQAWCDGKTGFPIVDAAMRQLSQTGWMHNRLRMIAASFLTKLLFIDWRIGETYFMNTLIDGEFAANNGGWQWSASTGCDAVPYFRVFNPTRQSEKFDPEGEFIRRFVPEIASLDNKSIHNPNAESRIELAYPHPIIQYKEARQHAIAAFAQLNSTKHVL
ncbi:deoxyribodipyrimidine photo-lyase [Marinomonas sp. 15G1-11]|uniref:Deoxyribodipyrimidine photo-lyase n=1 Tax=Marinomonas phaeophyticola TaxID=3004091 RepID=A0ABT4JRK9_9GAMM|nr:FAD-binding domain-containing protein [Marinomonas sp. 15G1-11]MCZ2720885.1 deoxyribodipyrimidine photo-lyase [Marinomonas sp. 15G1-11]